MSRNKMNTANGNFRHFRPLLKTEIRSYLKPYLFSAVFCALSLLASFLTLLIKGELPTALYAILYASIITAALVTIVTPTVRTVFDIDRIPLYKKNSVLPQNSIPTSKEFTAARFVSIVIFTLFSSFIYAVSELSVTLCGGHYYDGYIKGFVANIVIFFSVVFYFALILLVSAADFDPKAKHPERKCVLGGILIYTLGLVILVAVILSVSGLSFGSDAVSDISDAEVTSQTMLILSVIYFAASVLRSVYLFYLAKSRLGRKLKLMKK